MKVNVNHPTFVVFLDDIITAISEQIKIETYFTLTPDKKLNVQYVVFKMLKVSLNSKIKMIDDDFKNFITILWKKNEEYENYELAGLLKDIINNFSTLNEIATEQKITPKVPKNSKIGTPKKD